MHEERVWWHMAVPSVGAIGRMLQDAETLALGRLIGISRQACGISQPPWASARTHRRKFT
jgi:hypothetical protein